MIRELHPSEFELLKPIFDEQQCALPDPQYSRVVASFDERGLLRGFAVMQLTIHLEPVWVAPTERGSDLWEKLMQAQLDLMTIHNAMGDVYAFAPRPAIEKLLEKRLGFERMGWDVMRKKL